MRFTDKKIECLNDFINFLKEDKKKCEGPVWFRGQSNHEWMLIPSINRNAKKKKKY